MNKARLVIQTSMFRDVFEFESHGPLKNFPGHQRAGLSARMWGLGLRSTWVIWTSTGPELSKDLST